MLKDLKYLKIQRIDEKTIVIIINRRAKLNALSDEIKTSLISVASNLQNDVNIRTVILKGEGSFFSSGNDITEKNAFGRNLKLDKARERIRLGPKMIEEWIKIPAITIAVVEGAAIGGAMSLALACDFRILNTDAYFQAPEVSLGITFGWHAIYRLSSLVGLSRVKRITLLCEKIPSKQALEWGMADEVTDNPYNLAIVWSRRIKSFPKTGLLMAKESIERICDVEIYNGYTDADRILLSLTEPSTSNSLEKARIKLNKNK